MHEALGPEWELVEEALNGRTTVFEDPIEPHRNGLAYWPACLLSHLPLDVIVIALGVNDLKRRFSLSAFDIAAGAGRLVDVARSLATDAGKPMPSIVLVAPAPLARLTGLADMFEGGTQTSQDLARHYQSVAVSRGVACVAMGEVVTMSDRDGIHLDTAAHLAWGQHMAKVISGLAEQRSNQPASALDHH